MMLGENASTRFKLPSYPSVCPMRVAYWLQCVGSILFGRQRDHSCALLHAKNDTECHKILSESMLVTQGRDVGKPNNTITREQPLPSAEMRRFAIRGSADTQHGGSAEQLRMQVACAATAPCIPQGCLPACSHERFHPYRLPTRTSSQYSHCRRKVHRNVRQRPDTGVALALPQSLHAEPSSGTSLRTSACNGPGMDNLRAELRAAARQAAVMKACAGPTEGVGQQHSCPPSPSRRQTDGVGLDSPAAAGAQAAHSTAMAPSMDLEIERDMAMPSSAVSKRRRVCHANAHSYLGNEVRTLLAEF
jgi:hypothetical protein